MSEPHIADRQPTADGLTAAEPMTHVRYKVLAFACALAVVTYAQRLGFSAAMPEIKASLGLDANRMADLAAIWLIAYGLFQVPGGLLGDRYGARRVLTVLVFVWSVLTAVVGVAKLLPQDWAWHFALGKLPPQEWTLPFLFLLVMRFLFGAFQAGGYPVLGRVMADWMPVTERGFAQGCIWTLSRVGGFAIPLFLSDLFKLFGDWPIPFVLLGGLGLPWCAWFWGWFRNRPEQMPGVSRSERPLIEAGRPPAMERPRSVPWARMLRSPSVWSLCLMYGFTGFSGNFFTSGMLPIYLSDYRSLDEDHRKWLTGLPLLGGAIACVLGGFVSDQLIRRTGSRTWGRRASGLFGLSLAGLALLATLWVQDVRLLGLLLTLSFFGNDLTMGPAWASCADIAERYTGTLSGGMNMIGAFFGAIATKLVGYLLDTGQPQLIFIIFAVGYGLAALSWLGVDVTKRLTDAPPSAT
jgi:sugar phosphate permease